MFIVALSIITKDPDNPNAYQWLMSIQIYDISVSSNISIKGNTAIICNVSELQNNDLDSDNHNHNTRNIAHIIWFHLNKK